MPDQTSERALASHFARPRRAFLTCLKTADARSTDLARGHFHRPPLGRSHLPLTDPRFPEASPPRWSRENAVPPPRRRSSTTQNQIHRRTALSRNRCAVLPWARLFTVPLAPCRYSKIQSTFRVSHLSLTLLGTTKNGLVAVLHQVQNPRSSISPSSPQLSKKASVLSVR